MVFFLFNLLPSDVFYFHFLHTHERNICGAENIWVCVVGVTAQHWQMTISTLATLGHRTNIGHIFPFRQAIIAHQPSVNAPASRNAFLPFLLPPPRPPPNIWIMGGRVNFHHSRGPGQTVWVMTSPPIRGAGDHDSLSEGSLLTRIICSLLTADH